MYKACKTKAQDGVKILTKSAEIQRVRSVSMELILSGHPAECTSCKAYLKCALQTLKQYLGIVSARMRHIHREATIINNNNPLIVNTIEGTERIILLYYRRLKNCVMVFVLWHGRLMWWILLG